MRKIKEIKHDLSQALREVENATGEELAVAKGKVVKYMKELEEAERAEEQASARATLAFEGEQRSRGQRFSLLKFIREAVEGRGFTGIEALAFEQGQDESKRLGLSANGVYIPASVLRAAAGQNYTTDADGGALKETGAIRYIEALRDKLVLAQLGATYMGNLVGTIPIVTDSSITASWLAEAASATTSKVSFSKATMTPKRIAVQGAFTRDLLRQTSIDVDALVTNKLAEAHAQAIEKAAINGSGSGQPTGILNTTGIGSVAGGTNGAEISWKNVVALETAVNQENAGMGKLAYLTNAKVIGALKTTEKATGTARFLLDPLAGDNLNGYPIAWTNLVPSNLTKGTAADKCNAMIFGNFEDLYIGQWGGIDLVVDPYTKAGTGEILITLNAWNDVLVARPKSFAAIKDIL